ncbi:NAD(P)-dependent oxidoreductase [Saccharopolyspora indica]|uniref:NAD(P)-dependent oxidoreductase n=1 Tax=Saccharopolyspora indica TaxID=1229659 RepID=UPI0022EB609A|nr:NAD(P)-dependent oxidoreductase [Saccharopolyspora indica]MDA3647659.1 NAD(P)-dependent oxidoreductase [Saccharopolyspora indica]
MDKQKLALIGLGNMGGGVAHRLLDAGYPLTVHNRTAAKTAPLVAAGAQQAPTPARAAADADIVLLSLSDERAVEEVLFGGLLPVLRPGTPIVDTSTVSPSFARSAAERLTAAGMRRVEACLIGNPLQARAGELRILTGGAAADVAAVRPVLESAGREVVHLGGPGTASVLKLVLNLLLGAQLASFVEAISYGENAGLERQVVLDVITATTGFASEVMRFRAGFIERRDYEPAAFRARLMEKDLRLALQEAAELGIELPVISRTAERFADVVATGRGDQDAAVLMELHEQPEPVEG